MFTSLSHLAQYAPGVDTSLTIEDLKPALRTARKRIEAIITPAVYAAIAALATAESSGNSGTSETSGTSESSEYPSTLLSPLRTALANQALSTQLIFDAVNRRRSGTDIYKYEIEAMRRAYAENYFSAMDSLIAALEDGVNGLNGDNGQESPSSPSESFPYTLWLSTRHHALLTTCRIKSTADFDAIYPIDLSHLFFFRTIPLQREALDERIAAYYERAEENEENGLDGDNGQDTPSASSLPLLNLALAKRTIAKALRRFDPLEFPPTIRNLFDETNSPGNRANETMALLSLADRLDQEADSLLEGVDTLLDSSADVASATAQNLPTDNIYMMP